MSAYWLHNNGVIRETEGGPGEGLYCKPRRVVLLDPEDREQVNLLMHALWAEDSHLFGARRVEAWVKILQAALRNLVEPNDPTARVTDRRDNIWRLLADGDWVCTSGPDIGEYLSWDRLAGDRGPVFIEVQS